MLREGWDVPEVAVVLPLRKMGSRVYGPQIIGRGLRRVRRSEIPDEESQICAVVDHPKLEHDWLWDLLRARVRKDVGVQQEFDEQGELPSPPPRQELVNPDMIIAIPEAADDGSDFEPVATTPSPEPARNWRELLAQFEYEQHVVEITDQQITGVIGSELGKDGWTRHVSPPTSADGGDTTELSSAELAESIGQRLRSISTNACIEHGWSLHEQRYIYSPSLQHLNERFFNHAGLQFAEPDQLRRAIGMLPQLESFLLARPDVVGGMIEYADD